VAEDKGDIFAGFILRVGRVITDLQARNVATRGRVIAVGVSRGGYLAFRLAISDPRVTDVIALAPVTDLQRLREFAAVKVDEATYGLGRGAAILARKREFIQIGSNDDRVGTREVLHLVDGLAASAGANRLDLTFLLEPLVGHATSEHERAAAWALSPSPGLGASPPPPR
jgi:pimeloyl-ACP methyl ester carboxylesterase